jgi:hypothetical protein
VSRTAAIPLAALAVALIAASAASAAPRAEGLAAQPLRVGEHLVARPRHASVALRRRPGGAVLVRADRRTIFGSPLVLGVTERRGPWVAVTSELLPNGRIGWVDTRRDVSLDLVRYELRADLSARRLDVFRGGRRVKRIAVAIGSATSPTPTGRFAVAEKLSGPSIGTAYGCCILGLTAHQPRPPAGWDRTRTWFVAIHGGGGIGAAVSAGCFHASEAELRYLMRTIPLGTPIVVRR